MHLKSASCVHLKPLGRERTEIMHSRRFRHSSQFHTRISVASPIARSLTPLTYAENISKQKLPAIR